MSLPRHHVTPTCGQRATRFGSPGPIYNIPTCIRLSADSSVGGTGQTGWRLSLPTLQFLSGTCVKCGYFGSRLLHGCGNGGVLKEGFPPSARAFDCIMCQTGAILARLAISSCLWLMRTTVVDRARLIGFPPSSPPLHLRPLASQCLLRLGLADASAVPLPTYLIFSLLATAVTRFRARPPCAASLLLQYNHKQPYLGDLSSRL